MNRKRIVTGLYREWRHRPFAWSTADCLAFAGAAANAITGHDPGGWIRRRYTTETGAKRVMAREGVRDMGEAAAGLLPEIPLGQAMSGDWAYVCDDHGNDCIGVVCGHLVIVRTAEAGMGLMPLTRATRAFKVGR